MADFIDEASTSQRGHANPSAIQAYEMTPEGGVGLGGACADSAGALITPHPPLHHPVPQTSQQLHHDPRKTKPNHYVPENYEISPCDSQRQSPHGHTPRTRTNSTRKRKPSSYGTGSAYDDDEEDSRSTTTTTTATTRGTPDKKQNHSEIEKRRRDKMNTFISELSAMIPMCGAMARKLDKLTVLRMAVQHLRTVRGALSACPLTARPCPTYLTERELNALILQAAHDCFLLVVGCDRGRLLYVSASVKNILHYDQSELLGQSLFDILHPKDVAKVKEQLSSSDLSPRERLIDAKTMLPLKADVVAGASRFGPGARRSFFCRIKCKLDTEEVETPPQPVKEEVEPVAKMRKKHSHEKNYCVVQCTGYLKSWAPTKMCDGASAEGGEESEACNMSCLVAVGRTLGGLAPTTNSPTSMPQTRHLQYVSRHTTDGKFLFVDQRVTLALGFLPQELLGTSLYEYVHGPELGAVARTHKAALLQRDALHTPPYCFRRKNGSMARIQTHFKPFKNPWTKDVECLVANNTVVSESQVSLQQDTTQAAFDIYKQKSDVEMQRLIDSQVESHKIGSAIAEEALRRSSTDYSPDLPTELLQDAVFNQQFSPLQVALVDNILGTDSSTSNQVRNNVPLSSVSSISPPAPSVEETTLCDTPPPPSPPLPSPPLPPLVMDGNGEAAMAVIMSLLEADAGLGGPINFSGLPWPLP